ncbi:MAG: hypothetical protein NZL92_05605 [Gloeomargarita sp. SKYG116]|nr:hypothetical protein [Gloeomargarita sp. SKYG116]MCS7225645.1 hypothetical protein [Gloeomargarita sp. SKYB31]MDW8401152.1 hypothetical protein [Gloeomargarita sp. SKYGB_i_bin116]
MAGCMETPVQTQSLLGGQRWAIYHRLRELEIPCRCIAYGPLEMEVTTPLAALLVWSVVRQMTASRGEQVAWLERCWQLDT